MFSITAIALASFAPRTALAQPPCCIAPGIGGTSAFPPLCPDGHREQKLFRLNGLPPGDPVIGTLKLAHLDGLNLSRGWMLEAIAERLPRDDVRGDARAQVLAGAAHRHREAGLAAVPAGHDAGRHWLGSFAVYLLTHRGRAT